MPEPGASYYDRVRRWSATTKYAEEMARLWQSMALPSGARVLDVGAGALGGLEFLSRQGLRPIGVDRGQGWERFKNGHVVARADAAALPFRDESFAGALLMHSLAHLARPVEGLHEIARVLTPGGRLGVLTPNALHLAVYRLPGLKDRHYRPDETVERHLRRSTLLALFQQTPLRILRVETIGPGVLGLPLGSLRERLLLVAEKVA